MVTALPLRRRWNRPPSKNINDALKEKHITTIIRYAVQRVSERRRKYFTKIGQWRTYWHCEKPLKPSVIALVCHHFNDTYVTDELWRQCHLVRQLHRIAGVPTEKGVWPRMIQPERWPHVLDLLKRTSVAKETPEATYEKWSVDRGKVVEATCRLLRFHIKKCGTYFVPSLDNTVDQTFLLYSEVLETEGIPARTTRREAQNLPDEAYEAEDVEELDSQALPTQPRPDDTHRNIVLRDRPRTITFTHGVTGCLAGTDSGKPDDSFSG